MEIDASDICATSFPTEHANVMRSSVVLIGALLGRMGEISICYPGGCVIGRRTMVCGVKKLRGTVVEAKELRGGAALLLAGLSADGDTYIKNDVFIRRGYENIVRDLKLLGAKIEEE